MPRKPGQRETEFYAQLKRLTDLGKHHQQAIEELTNKCILLAQNLNTQQFRTMVTERLMKEKLGITPDEIMAAGLAAIEDDRQQRTAEQEQETQEPPRSGSATTPESVRTALAAGAAAPAVHLLPSTKRSLQTQ